MPDDRWSRTPTRRSGHTHAQWDDTDGVSVVREGMDLMDRGLYMRPDDLDVNGNPVDPGVVGLCNMAMAPETITEVVFDPESATIGCVGTARLALLIRTTEHGAEGPLGVPRPGRSHQLACLRPRGSARGSYSGGKPGGHDGSVVQPVFNDNGFRVDIFDAADVSAGPVATLAGTNREMIPLVLHSAWMPTFHGLADAQRLRFSDDVNAESMSKLPEEFHASVHAVAEECDDLW